jgi:hypothetical protein
VFQKPVALSTLRVPKTGFDPHPAVLIPKERADAFGVFQKLQFSEHWKAQNLNKTGLFACSRLLETPSSVEWGGAKP